MGGHGLWSQHQEESFSFVKGQIAHEMCQYLISD